MSGYEPEELVGRTPRLLQGPNTDPAVTSKMAAELQAYGQAEGEVINYGKDGRQYLISWAIAPLRRGSGQLAGWLAVQNDISDGMIRSLGRPAKRGSTPALNL